jgi:hypothetical protein
VLAGPPPVPRGRLFAALIRTLLAAQARRR